MQAPKEKNDTKNVVQPEPDAELSATWQALLGLPVKGKEKARPNDPTAPVQPLTGDPWNSLVNASGMQPVDLQQAHLHKLRAAIGDDQDDHDIENALKIMREATGQLPVINEKPKDA